MTDADVGSRPTTSGPAVTIRGVRTGGDWQAVRELCCRTGDAGNPVEASRWAFFAEVWIGPYQRMLPRWAYVAEAAGTVVGYLTGCPDTCAFRRSCRLAFALPLLLRVARGRYPWKGDTRRFVRRTLGLEKGPEERILSRLPSNLYGEYPAHLHMNVDAGARSRGIGRALLERYVEDLRESRVRGVHLFCGTAPRPFYLRLGFTELGRLEFRPGVWVYALGRSLERGRRA